MGPQHRIKEIRESIKDSNGKKMSGIMVARKLGITPQYYYDIERGDRNLSAEHASKLSDLFGVSVDYLLKKTENKNLDPITEYLEHEAVEMNSELLTNLKLLVDDEGNFFEDIREEVFNAIVESNIWIIYSYHRASDDDYYKSLFKNYFSNSEDHQELEHKEIVEEFNKAYNYRILKTAIIKTEDFEVKEELLNMFKKIVVRHNLKTPVSFERELSGKSDLLEKIQSLADKHNIDLSDPGTLDLLDSAFNFIKGVRRK